MNKNDFIALSQLTRDVYLDIELALNHAAETAKSFDGKIVNARLSNAMQESIDTHLGRHKIFVSISLDKNFLLFKSRERNINEEHTGFAHYVRKETKVKLSQSDNRINAEDLCANLIEAAKIMLKNAERQYVITKEFDAYELLRTSLEAVIKNYVDSVPVEYRDVFAPYNKQRL